MVASLLGWLNDVPILLLGALLFASMAGAGLIGHALRLRANRIATYRHETADGQEGYIVSAVLGLLALLMGFTLSMALDRFEIRRVLVLTEANAIKTTYLRAQVLGEPHRARLSRLLVEYTDNRIALATAQPEEVKKLVVGNDQLLTDIWAATAAAFDSISNLDFSSALIEGANDLIELDAARKASRTAHVPTEIFAVLLFYLFSTAGILGYVLAGTTDSLPRASCSCC